MNISEQARQLFNFYDRDRIGLIPKHTLLTYLSLIDNLITQEWLSKSLIAEGLTIGEYINCEEFIRIIKVLQNLAEQSDYAQCQG